MTSMPTGDIYAQKQFQMVDAPMNVTNIFTGMYEQRENQLTYRFLSLLEHLDPAKSVALLGWSGRTFNGPRTLLIDTIYTGFAGNPDGSISLDYESSRIVIFLEIKSSVRPVDADQIRRHLDSCIGKSTDKLLLVVAANARENECLASIEPEYPQQLGFTTWKSIAERCVELISDEIDSKDEFLLQQFAQYLKNEPYAGVTGMIQRDELDAMVKLNELRLREKETAFKNEAAVLLTELRDKLCPSFGKISSASNIIQEWGIWIYVNCDLRESRNSKVQFGIRYREDEFEFVEKYQPEFGVWVTTTSEGRLALDGDQQIRDTTVTLRENGYSFNIPPRTKSTRWLLCSWFEPVQHFVEKELDSDRVRRKFEEQLRVLLDSDFLSRALALGG
jgi:hypothetical protein